MKTGYNIWLLSSFKEWFQHILLEEGEAFINFNNDQLFEMTSNKDLKKSLYAARRYQWVYDASITGANVPTTIEIGGTPTARGTSGLMIDFNNGRAIFNNNTNTGLTNVTASYAQKEFNIYISTQPEEKLIFESQYNMLPELLSGNSGLPPNQIIAPLIFVTMRDSQMEPVCFGGVRYWDLATLRVIVFAPNDHSLMSIFSLFKEKKHRNFPILSSTPLNEYGDLKTPGWSYASLLSAATVDDLVFIESVITSPLADAKISSMHPKLRVGIIQFEVTKSRSI